MKKMTKIAALALSGALALGLMTGCGNDDAQQGADDSKVVNVGFVQLVDMADATLMHDAFLEEIKAAGLENNIVVDFQDAAGDQNTMMTMIQGFVDNNYDLIVPMLTPPAQAAKTMAPDTPMIFMSVTEPVYARIIEDMNMPGDTATGTSNRIPAELSLAAAQTITPLSGDQKCLIMYNSSQVNAEATKDNAVEYCEANNIPYEIKAYEDVPTALSIAQSLSKNTTGYVYVCLDSIIANNFNQVAEALNTAGIPSYNAADAMVLGGGFASFAVDYSLIGKMTADMVIDWYNGKAISEMPVQVLEDFTFVVNEDTMNTLGITLPEQYADTAKMVNTVVAN